MIRLMKYYICQLIGSEIYSNYSYVSDPDDNRTPLNPYNSFSGEWGRVEYDILESFEKGYGDVVNIIWGVNNGGSMSIYKFRNRYEPSDDDMIFGLSPYGRIAIWSSNGRKQRLLSWKKSSELSNDGNSQTDGYSRLMTQYTYRYVVEFGRWNEKVHKWGLAEAEFDMKSLQENLFDGTFDKENDGNLFKFHNAGVPRKMHLTWKLAESEYNAYFFFDQDIVITFFEKFYGIHPDTKTDFIIRMDPCRKRYELSLYRYGLQSPVVINGNCFQLIVFKNGFENYKSDKFSQADGAWIW